MRQRGLGDPDGPECVGVHDGSGGVLVDLLDGPDQAVPGVVHHHVEPLESVHPGRDVQQLNLQAVAVADRQLRQHVRVANGSDHPFPGDQCGFGERPAVAPAGPGDQPRAVAIEVVAIEVTVGH